MRDAASFRLAAGRNPFWRWSATKNWPENPNSTQELLASVTNTLASAEPSERRIEHRRMDLSISSPAMSSFMSENVSQNETGAEIVRKDETCPAAMVAA